MIYSLYKTYFEPCAESNLIKKEKSNLIQLLLCFWSMLSDPGQMRGSAQ